MDPRQWSWELYYSVVVLVIVSVTLLYSARRRRDRKLNLPPGPKPWPVVGNVLQLGSHPHRSLYALSQKYGPIMQLRLGSFPVVIASTAEMAKQFLHDHDLNFLNRPKPTAAKLLGYNWSNMSWSSYGPYWRQARKIYAAELLSPRRIAAYEHVRREERMSLLRGLFASAGQTINLRDRLFTASINIISRILFGKPLSEFFPMCSPAELRGCVDELFLLNGVINIGDRIPWLSRYDLQGYTKRMKALNTKLDRLFEHAIDVHRQRQQVEGKDWTPKDVVDVFLQLADDPDLEVPIGKDNIKAFMSEFLASSTDTTTLTLEWAIFELMKNPDYFDNATKELDLVIGKEKWVEESNIDQLIQIEMITKETMRMHPVAPFLPHVAKEDCIINGFDILASTEAIINVWAIGRDPGSWESPLDFNPKRFISKIVDVKGNHFDLLPFGTGRRICPGMHLGLKVVQTTLANLLHGFDWKLPNGVTPHNLDTEESFGLTLSKKVPLEVIAMPRLPDQLYH